MKSTPTTPHRWNGWLIILLPLLIACSVLLLTETTQAAPTLIQSASPSGELLFQQSQPACQSCHAEEYDVWKNSVHASRARPGFPGAVGQAPQPGRVPEVPHHGLRQEQRQVRWPKA